MKILGMSEGTIGEVSTILTKAAVLAIRRGTERIDAKLLDEIAYTPPATRRRGSAGAP
jgi:hypothetical protein